MTKQIEKASKSLLENEIDSYSETVLSDKEGDKPIVAYFDNSEEQVADLFYYLKKLQDGNELNSTVVLHRTSKGVKEIIQVLDNGGYSNKLINSNADVNYSSTDVKVCKMSTYKDMEFSNVFIVDLNDNIIPGSNTSTEITSDKHISTERRLLFTCMIGALNKLFLFSSGVNTRYLDEIDYDLLHNRSPLPGF